MDPSLAAQHKCGYYIIIIIVVRPSISVALGNRLISIKLFRRAGNLFCRLMYRNTFFRGSCETLSYYFNVITGNNWRIDQESQSRICFKFRGVICTRWFLHRKCRGIKRGTCIIAFHAASFKSVISMKILNRFLVICQSNRFNQKLCLFRTSIW